MVTKKLFIHGRVQGVFFRNYAAGKARQLGINGFVRNLSDGSTVEVVAQGPEDNIKEFINLLKEGPPDALVESTHIEQLDNAPEFNSYSIR